jgi:2-phospho-L-lactate guanylyltransferase
MAMRGDMRALLLPIKDIRNAKQRLAGFLSPGEREGLARAMAEDVLRAVTEVRGAHRICVVTSDPEAMRTAESNGWDLLREKDQTSESASVDFASRRCAEQGFTSVLRLPLDLPLVQARDIEELLSLELPAPGCAIIPSRDATGTNALLRTPPALFPSQFGEGSFAKHRLAAEQTGARVVVLHNSRIEMDVDDEADLRALLRHDLDGTATGRWLADSGVAERLGASARAVGAR